MNITDPYENRKRIYLQVFASSFALAIRRCDRDQAREDAEHATREVGFAMREVDADTRTRLGIE